MPLYLRGRSRLASKGIGSRSQHSHCGMAATLDGMVEEVDAVFEAKFMLPWSFSEEAGAEKHMAQLQHNSWVVNTRSAALSIITAGVSGDGGGPVLALRSDRRDPTPLWRRGASAADRCGSRRRH